MIKNKLEWILEKEIRIIIFIFFSGFIACIPILKGVYYHYDDNAYVKCALVILQNNGGLYKDFTDIKSPGIYFFYALFIKLFSFKYLEPAFDIFLYLFYSTFSYIIFKLASILYKNKKVSFFLALFFFVFILNIRHSYFVNSHQLAMFFVILAVYQFLKRGSLSLIVFLSVL